MGTTCKNSCKTATVMGLLTRRADVKNPALGAVSESGTIVQREQIEYIDTGRIDDDPSNFYELSGLDELAANIELLGLQQPIRVRPGEEAGRYVIVSGHRRRAAVRKLVEDGREDLRELPCIVERGQASAALQELRLIYANSDTRKMSPAEVGKQAERVEALLYQLKEEGYEFPGRMRDYVAEACKVSKSKLARLKVIRENLAKPWRRAYETGKLSEAAAYALAQMPAERQQVICDGLAKQGKMPGSAQEYMVRTYGENLDLVEQIECRTYGNGPCLNREAMRERIMARDHWSYSYCRQCCGQCPELAKCKYACPMLADEVKRLKADAKAQREQDKRAREEKARPKVEAIQKIWKRFGKARAAAGKSVEECFKPIGKIYNEGIAEKCEGFERSGAEVTEDTDLPYGHNYYLDAILRCVKTADLLGVSLDYLLCRTDDPAGFAPQVEGQLVFAGWMPGGTLPGTPCDVVADFDMGDGTTNRIVCEFCGENFRFRNTPVVIEAEPVRWMVLPPVGVEKYHAHEQRDGDENVPESDTSGEV